MINLKAAHESIQHTHTCFWRFTYYWVWMMICLNVPFINRLGIQNTSSPKFHVVNISIQCFMGFKFGIMATKTDKIFCLCCVLLAVGLRNQYCQSVWYLHVKDKKSILSVCMVSACKEITSLAHFPMYNPL